MYQYFIPFLWLNHLISFVTLGSIFHSAVMQVRFPTLLQNLNLAPCCPQNAVDTLVCRSGWKCCTQHINKVGKLSSGHRTGKGLFSFQFQRQSMPKNVPTIIKFCSFHMLAKLCSKSLKVGYSSMWTENFQMFKLCYKETEEPVFMGNCQHSWDHRESKRVSEKHIFLLHWLC